MSCRFGVRNEDRRRGLKLLMNGHLDPSTFELSRGMHAVTGHDVIAITCRCCASMRPKVYSCVCVFDAVTGVQLPAPDSKCDCVCGFECSHRFALGDLFVGFLQLLPTDTTYEQLCGYIPDSLTRHAHTTHTVSAGSRTLGNSGASATVMTDSCDPNRGVSATVLTDSCEPNILLVSSTVLTESCESKTLLVSVTVLTESCEP